MEVLNEDDIKWGTNEESDLTQEDLDTFNKNFIDPNFEDTYLYFMRRPTQIHFDYKNAALAAYTYIGLLFLGASFLGKGIKKWKS